MKSHSGLTTFPRPGQAKTSLLLCALAAVLPLLTPAGAAPNVTLWDTGAPLASPLHLEDRGDWTVVPADLFGQEADPAKAASDPGYYGREYEFKGDAVVENASLMAVFHGREGRIVLYAKDPTDSPQASAPNDPKEIATLLPLGAGAPPAFAGRLEIVRNVDDEVALSLAFGSATPGAPGPTATFVFDKTGLVEVNPTDGLKGFSLQSPLAYGVAPDFIADDLVYSGADHPSENSLCVPAANVFLGLVRGEEAELLLTWPQGKQRLTLQLADDAGNNRVIKSIDFEDAGQSFYLAPLRAPGLWHREKLSPSYLEKDVAIQWKRPFPAKWQTQLEEAGVKTTFAFKETKGQIWRGVPGSYSYPVWFDGDETFYHLSKKIPPRGESLVYFLEGSGTPRFIPTPVDIIKASLGRSFSDLLLDRPGRKLRTHHRRGGEGVHRACTCGCTEAIQAVFESGQEVRKKEYIAGALDDMIYFVERHVARINEYRSFADATLRLLRASVQSSPDLKSYAETLTPIVQQIPEEYSIQQENMKSLDFAADLERRTMALTNKRDPNNLKAYMDLLAAWRSMGGAQDYVVARCHMIARQLAQEAGYASATHPKAVELASEIRARCRQVLRNPDGYEIWADY